MSAQEMPDTEPEAEGLGDIAIIGLAGRFPRSPDVRAFWKNLREGVECIRRFEDGELLEAGVRPEELADPNYVRAWGWMDDIDLFDAGFFGFTPREAEIADPQIRFFLETAWEALEDAGYDPSRYPGAIGVFAGTSSNAYVIDNLLTNPAVLKSMGFMPTALFNQTDFLSTRASYKLDLRGPSMTVQTACSTSLVATHLACQSLLSGESDMALAGGVCVSVLRKRGYAFIDGGTFSSDGHVRTFDAKGQGMLGANGVGIVVLKRLEDAVRDGDSIRAVIKGSALNNDGVDKVGFTAPSVNGQADVILDALEISGVDPATITSVEAHGTATPLGDPIEIAALSQAWRTKTDAKGYCAIGSLKTNLGHLDIAAGVAGLIKVALSLEAREIPPSLNFEEPNPEIDFASSPFFVNTELRPWDAKGSPRRAAVSSFGMGGTNAHAILEEAPQREPSAPVRSRELVLLSARTPTALDAMATRLAEHLREAGETPLCDVAYTTQVGRKAFVHRRALVAADVQDAVALLERPDPTRSLELECRADGPRSLALLFSGQGAQYPNMTRGLYESEPTYARELDRCCELLAPAIELDLRELLFPAAGGEEAAAERLQQTQFTQPALFAVEYALSKLWMEWGIVPEAMLGHSVGEYVAACLAGVFSLEDALRLVAARGRLIGSLPAGGGMLAVHVGESELTEHLGRDISLAAVNGPELCVLSGPLEALEAVQAKLESAGVGTRALRTSHAFHSGLMDPILEDFEREVAQVSLSAPERAVVSCTTGTWLSDAEATDPKYWVRHLRQAVRFTDGLRTLREGGECALLEVGPGETLASLAKLSLLEAPEAADLVVASTRHPRDERDDVDVLLLSAARLWACGVELDWEGFHRGAARARVSLPTYPFERQRYWIEPGTGFLGLEDDGPRKRSRVADWFHVPSWKQSPPPVENSSQGERWLVLADDGEVADALAASAREAGAEVRLVRAGAAFSETGDGYTIDPAAPEDYGRLLEAVRAPGGFGSAPDRIVHLFGAGSGRGPERDPEGALARGFYSVLFLGQALSTRAEQGLELVVVTRGIHDVWSGESDAPELAPVLGAAKALDCELERVRCRVVELAPAGAKDDAQAQAERLRSELASGSADSLVALQGPQRWVKGYEPVALPDPDAKGVVGAAGLRDGGVYLITGGLGGVGFSLAEELAERHRAKLVLTARSALPERASWPGIAPDDPAFKRIDRVKRLEDLGAEVLVLAADVADRAAMAKLVDEAESELGAIRGVIHAAGLPGAGILELKTRADAAAVLSPKVQGTLVLAQLMAERELDFLVLCSSIASATRAVGQVDYFGANAFLDAFAHRAGGFGKTRVISINWDAWQDVGMAAEIEVPEAMRAERAAMLQNGIAPSEGRQAFRYALACGLPQVVVSTRELTARPDYEHRLPDPEVALEETSESTASPAAARARYPRPPLATEFVAPRNATEEAIAAIWCDLLGLEQVGALDGFFELGGNSLVMMQLNVRLRGEFGVSLPIRSLFEMATVSALSQAVESVLGIAHDGEDEASEEEMEEFTL